MYFKRHKIDFKYKHSKYSDYYYILNIKGKDNHTLKIRVSNHSTDKKFEIPFCSFWYTKSKVKIFPSKWSISNQLGSYIAKYKYIFSMSYIFSNNSLHKFSYHNLRNFLMKIVSLNSINLLALKENL